MATYTASNGAIVADLTALIATPSTSLPSSGFVVLFVASENNWYEYNPALTSGDATPINNPTNGRWVRIGRDRLTANRTYYVRTDGSDSNNGLTNTSGGAFLTIPKAIDVVSSLDINIYDVTIRVGAGTYTTPVVLKSLIGSGTVTIRGDNNDNTSTIISTTSSDAISGYFDGKYSIQYLKIQTTTSGNCLNAEGFISFGNVNFGACANFHIVLESAKAQYRCIASYAISGGTTGYHIACLRGGYILVTGITLTITGTPNFPTAFIWAAYCSQVLYYSNTISGSATGSRYLVTLNAVLFAGGATLPGSIAGTTATGGQYS